MTPLVAVAVVALVGPRPPLLLPGDPGPPGVVVHLPQDGAALAAPGVVKGERYKQTISRETKTRVAVNAPAGEHVHEQAVTERFAHADEVEASEPVPGKGPPATVVRTFEAAEATADGQAHDYELTGRAVRLECGADKTGVTAADKAGLSDKAEAAARRSLYSPLYDHMFALLPPAGKKVKVGDDWPLDPAHFADRGDTNHEIDVAGSTARGKLVKVYLKDGRFHTVVEVSASLVVVRQKGEHPVPFAAGSKVTVEATVDAGLFVGWQSHALSVTEVVKSELIAELPGGTSAKITSETTLTVETVPLPPAK